MKSPYLFTAVLLCSLSGLVLSQAQSAPSSSPAAVASASDKHYPDDAYLSGDRYTNPYFGFSFDFPANARLRPVPQPAASDGSVQLAELSGAPPADAGISIVAFRAGSRQGDAKTLLRQALDQQLFVGVEELHSLTKTTLAGHPFYFFETRRGIEQHMFLATELNGYVLRVILAAHDDKVLKQMEQQFQHLHFFRNGPTAAVSGSRCQALPGTVRSRASSAAAACRSARQSHCRGRNRWYGVTQRGPGIQ